MLKITVMDDSKTTRIKVEGRLAGPYVQELDRTWRGLAPSLITKALCVDLSDMTGVDEEGKQLLAEIYRQNHAEFIARSVLAEYYAEQARQRGSQNCIPGEPKCASRILVN
jgi:hypothetical protein